VNPNQHFSGFPVAPRTVRYSRKFHILKVRGYGRKRRDQSRSGEPFPLAVDQHGAAQEIFPPKFPQFG
jgi:hypothetical protein